jgi:DNA replication protein DnaC
VRAADFGTADDWQARTTLCGCREDAIAQARWERALAASDIAPRLLALDFASYDATHNPRALAAVQAWTSDAARASLPWLLLYGGMGSGKTHLLAAAFNALMAEGRYPLYTLVPALLDHVRDGLDDAKPGEYGARFRAVRETPILILDDLGAEKRSEWSDELLFKLLDYRYRQELPTAVASNLIPADLEERIASRLQDRALAVALLMSGPDYRLQPGQARSVGRRRRDG